VFVREERAGGLRAVWGRGAGVVGLKKDQKPNGRGDCGRLSQAGQNEESGKAGGKVKRSEKKETLCEQNPKEERGGRCVPGPLEKKDQNLRFKTKKIKSLLKQTT